MGGKPRLFKDWIDARVVRTIGERIAVGEPDFDAKRFIAAGRRGLADMELRARVSHLIACLHAELPQPFPRALAAIVRAVETDDDDEPVLRGFAVWPLIDYVGDHGVAHRKISLDGLRRMTSRFSAEFAIRPFLDAEPDPVLAELHRWAAEGDEHVRRLASEGTRPRLPWGRRLRGFVAEPGPVIELLERLRDDPSEYVRRSVANNLNDIAKDHPDRVAKLAKRWMRGASDERAKLVRHALRSLVKQGHAGALAVLGFSSNVAVSVGPVAVSPSRIALGEAIELAFDVTSTAKKAQRLVIDYAVHFVKSNGSRSAKVFKLKTASIGAGERLSVRKRHKVAPVTIRRHYPGVHGVEILVNGTSVGTADFDLTV
jgi:3-methyladenine DNA glycosylase AlkC